MFVSSNRTYLFKSFYRNKL